MEILYKGRLPEKRPWKGTCSHCKSIVAAEEGELKVESSQKDGEFAVADCPVCSRSMVFYPEE